MLLPSKTVPLGSHYQSSNNFQSSSAGFD